MKKIISVLVFLPLVAILFTDSSLLSEGIYRSKTALIVSFTLMGIALNVIINSKKLNGWAAWFAYGIVVFLGLFLPTLF